MSSITRSDNAVQAADRELARMREYTANLEAELDYEKRLYGVSNKFISPAGKIVLWALRRYISVLRDVNNSVGEYVEIHMRELSVLTGLCTATVGRNVQALHDVGMIDRKQEQERLKDGTQRTHVYVAFTLLTEHPEQLYITDDKQRNHGGERQYCRFCGSDKLVKRTVVVCKHCGNDQDEPQETPVNPPADPVNDFLGMSNQVEDIPADPPLPITSPLPAADPVDPPDDPVDFADEDTEKRPVVRPALRVVPPLPDRPDWKCKFGCGRKWTWFDGDKSEPAGYVCAECYSPAASSEGYEEKGGKNAWAH